MEIFLKTKPSGGKILPPATLVARIGCVEIFLQEGCLNFVLSADPKQPLPQRKQSHEEGFKKEQGTTWEREGNNKQQCLPLCPVGVLNILREDRSKVSCTAESRFSVENAPKPKFMS